MNNKEVNARSLTEAIEDPDKICKRQHAYHQVYQAYAKGRARIEEYITGGIACKTGQIVSSSARGVSAHLQEVAMLKEAHVRAHAVVSWGQLGAQLWGQLIEFQRPLAQREPARQQTHIRNCILHKVGMLPTV